MPPHEQDPPAKGRLRLVQTTDIHGSLLPFDYALDRPTQAGSLVQAADVIDELRADDIETLVLDCGDMLQGTPLADPTVGPGLGPPVIAAMNRIGYDAATIGNHDLDHGAVPLARALRLARFPVIASNLRAGGELGRLMSPSLILDRRIRLSDGQFAPIRIGLVGILPPQVSAWTAGSFDPPLETTGIVDTVAATSAQLRTKGADIVVVLSHSGEGVHGDVDDGENVAGLLRQLHGIDAVLAGHTHKISPAAGQVAQCGAGPAPLVAAGALGQVVGVIELDLERARSGRWNRTAAQARVIPTATRSGTGCTACRIRTDLKPAHDAARQRQNTILQRAPVPVTSHFSMVMPDLAQACLAAAIRTTALRLLDDHGGPDAPLLVGVPPMSAGGYGGPDNYVDAPDGIVRRRHIGQLFQFPNPVALIEVSGFQIADWLEQAVSIFHRVRPGERGQELIAPSAAPYNFDSLHGLCYEIDLSAPARYSPDGRLRDGQASRVRCLTWQGRALGPGDRFVVATSSFRASSGGHIRALEGTVPFAQSRRTIPDILARWFSSAEWRLPVVEQTWRFARVPDASAVFLTGPRATAPSTPDCPAAWATGRKRDGFALFELELDRASLANPGHRLYLAR